MRQIIYAWNYREWGGVQIYFLSLIKAAKKIGSVTVLLPENSDPRLLKKLDDVGVDRVFTASMPVLEQPKGFLAGLVYRIGVMRSENRMVSRILQLAKGRETVVHIDFGFWQSLIALFRLSRKTDVFVTQHTGMPLPNPVRDILWQVKGRIASRLRRLRYLASNNEAKASLGRYFGNGKLSDVVVTYTGVDPDEIASVSIDRGDVFSRYDLPDGKLVVTVGQFIERKGCWIVAEALKLLAEKGNAPTFIWLATAGLDYSQRERLESFGLGGKIRVLSSDDIGNSRSELLSIVRAADIFVLASLQEGLPIALVEAMALGRACITTRVNAIPEAVEDGVTGILIEPNDAGSLADVIAKLLCEPDIVRQLGDAARKKALALFNEKVTAATTLELYGAVWKSIA